MPIFDLIALLLTYLTGWAAAANYFIFEWMDGNLNIESSEIAAAILCGAFWPFTYIPHLYMRKV